MSKRECVPGWAGWRYRCRREREKVQPLSRVYSRNEWVVGVNDGEDNVDDEEREDEQRPSNRNEKNRESDYLIT